VSSKFTKFVDHLVGARHHIMIGCHFNAAEYRAARVFDTGERSLTCANLAELLMDGVG
jgi:hypothetical protein